MGFIKEAMIRAYNQLAYSYEHTVDVSSPYNSDYERPAMLELLPSDLAYASVLDAGCAAGWYCKRFLSLGAKVTAVDISPEMVAATKRRVGEHGNVLCHDLSTPLPFTDESFEFIVSSLTLHYIKEWEPTFREFRRVLKPFGTLLFSVHHPFMDFTQFDTRNYFSHNLLHDVWNSNSGEVDVYFYRRTLQTIINETTKHFTLKTVVEPRPQESFQQKDPKGYERLMTNPHFLIIKALKIT